MSTGSYYGVTFPEFWTGPTGRAIRAQGGSDAQVVALYLTSSRQSTMIGLYALPLRDVQHETGLGAKGLARALAVLAAVEFADYDAGTEHVWVREMAKFRLGLQRGALKPDDNRVTGAQRLYDRLLDNPFLMVFFDRYAKELRLRRRRACGLLVTPLLDIAPSKGLRRGLGGAYKPGTEISTYRDQGSEIRDQGSVRTNLPAQNTRRSSLAVENADENPDGSPPRSGSPALRDREDPDRSRADDRQPRMVGAHQGSPHPPGVHLPQGPLGDPSGHDASDAGARAPVGPEAGAGRAALPTPAAAPGRASLASDGRSRPDVDRGVPREPAGLTQLRRVIRQLGGAQ